MKRNGPQPLRFCPQVAGSVTGIDGLIPDGGFVGLGPRSVKGMLHESEAGKSFSDPPPRFLMTYSVLTVKSNSIRSKVY